MAELTYEQWYAKRDAVHDIVCRHFEAGSDDGLPVGDAVMEALYGPAPQKPAPSGTFRVYDGGGDGRDLMVGGAKPHFGASAPYAFVGLHGHRMFMDSDTARHVADTLSSVVAWLESRELLTSPRSGSREIKDQPDTPNGGIA